MAYVPPDQEEEAKQQAQQGQNPYGELFANPNGPTVLDPNQHMSSPATATTAGGGGRFVNMDRYLSANKQAVDNTNSKLLGGINDKASAVKSDAATQTDSLNQSITGGTVTGPDSNLSAVNGQIVSPSDSWSHTNTSTGIGTQKQALNRGGQYQQALTPEQLSAQVAKNFGGPSASDINSAYDTLATRSQAVEGDLKAVASGDYSALVGGPHNAFDSKLMGATITPQAQGLQKQWSGLDDYLSGARQKTLTADQAAQDASTAAHNSWQSLSDSATQQKSDIAAKKQADVDAFSKGQWDAMKQQLGKRYGQHAMANGTRPTGQELMDLLKKDVGGFGAKQDQFVSAFGKDKAAQFTKALDKMSDGDLKHFMTMMMGGDQRWQSGMELGRADSQGNHARNEMKQYVDSMISKYNGVAH